MSYTLKEFHMIDESLMRAKRIAKELFPNAFCSIINMKNGLRQYIIFDDSQDLQMSLVASGNTELEAWNVLVKKVEQETLNRFEI